MLRGLEIAHITTREIRHMFGQGTPDLHNVTGPDRLRDQYMLLEAHPVRCTFRPSRDNHDPDLPNQMRPRPHQRFIARQLADQGVESQISFDPFGKRKIRTLQRSQRFLQPVSELRAAFAGSQFGSGQNLQSGPNLENVSNLLGGETTNHHVTTAIVLYQALDLNLAEGFPQGTPGNAQLLAELRFLNVLTGRQDARNDLPTKVLNAPLAKTTAIKLSRQVDSQLSAVAYQATKLKLMSKE